MQLQALGSKANNAAAMAWHRSDSPPVLFAANNANANATTTPVLSTSPGRR